MKREKKHFFNQNEPILKAQVVDFIFSLPHSLLRQGGTRKTFLLYTALCKHCLFVVLWIFATDCTFIPSSSTFCIQYVQHSSVNTVQLKTQLGFIQRQVFRNPLYVKYTYFDCKHRDSMTATDENDGQLLPKVPPPKCPSMFLIYATSSFTVIQRGYAYNLSVYCQ